MANISPKLFQKAIQKGLKTALFTTSTAAIMLSSSGALGATTIDANTNFTVGAGLNPAGPFGGGVLQYGNDAVTVDADAAVNITAIDVHGFAPDLLTVNEDISLGSVLLGGGTAFPVSISNNFTLTLTGEDGLGTGDADTYDGLGNITLNGANAGLTINSGTPNLIMLDGTIDGGAAGQGVLRVSTDTTFAAAVGATRSLASITVDAGVTIYNATMLAATNIVVNGGEVNAIGAVNGAIDFANAGKLSAGGLVTGTAVLTTDGTLTLGNGITGGDITSVGGNGTVIVTAGNITNVGTGGSSVKQLTFNNTAASNAGNIFATDIKVNSATANVTGTGTINGAINFAQAGKLSATGAVTGTAVFNADGTLTLGAGISNAVTSVGNNGTLIVNAGDVGGAIGTHGGANILKQVTFNGASNVTSIDATNMTINNGAADVKAANAITAAVNFAVDGALTANNGITGAVTAAGGNGTLTTAGVGVTGAVGTNGASLKALNAKVDNGAADLVFTSDIYAQTVNFASVANNGNNAVGTIQVGGNLVATNVNFSANAAGGTLEFNGPGGNTYNLSGIIANGATGILNINAGGTVVANDASIGTVAQIDIQDNKSCAINAKNADVDILNAQAINFKGANSKLFLLNDSTTDNRVITLKNDLPAFATGGGTLLLAGTTKLVTLQGDGGAKTIGTAGSELASLNVLGSVAFNNIDTTNVLAFNILGTTNFVDVSGITNQINVINIGAAGVSPAGAAIAAAGGSYTIDANGGNVGILANGQTINFAHEDATLVLKNSAAGNGTITLNAVLDPLAPNKGKLAVDSGAAGGKVILASVGNATYGTIVNKLKELEFRGNGTFQIDTEIFANDLELLVPAVTYNKDINSNLSFGAATALTQNGNINGNVDFNNQAAVITLGANKNITGSVTSTGGVNGTIIATGASTINGPITNIAMLKVGAGAVSITQGGNTSIQGNGTALLTLPANFNLTGSINKTGGQALKLNFTNGGSVSGVVGTAANSVGDITTAGTTNFASSVNAKGAATLGGTTSFADTFTNTGAVTLAKASITNFAKNVTATSFAANNATINFGNSLAFNSNITGSGTTLTLGTNQVTYTGTGSFTDTLTLNTTFDGAAKSGGNILIKSGSTLDLSGVSTLALVVTATNFDINNISPDTKYTVISAEAAGGLKPTPAGNVKVTVNNDNRFVNFTFDESTLTLFAKDVSQEVIDNDFKLGGPLANIPNAANIKKSLELMEQAPIGSDARLAFGNWGKLNPIQEADAVTHLMQDVVKPSDTIAAINNQVIISNISSSLINLNARMDAIQPAAVAAGDEDRDAKFGAWISPFVGNATQKMRNNISGYKSDTTGGTIGFDGLVSDDLALGAAYTRADTDIKLKNNKTGDKNKVESNIYSVYGLYNVPYENLFVEAIASYSDNKIRSKSRRVIATALETVGYQTASGKYKSESYTGQLMAGYTYMMPENINLTPLAGLRYSAIKDKSYKETGTTNQNLIVKGKNYNSFDGLLGAKVSSNINVNEEVVLTPELYAMVDYAFKNKVPAIDARLQGIMTAPFPTNSFKQSKTSFDVGVGVTAKHKMMEYGINYDTNIGSKYFAQQGSVKVRVNF
ncbi:MAG: autotransporter outer membrane beta-barrel domain-containing protein [Rickettsia sp.]|uniref:autotransporter outer membrane beta-barrel domain-containing protein n=1 Tax=Rickettsia sp. TaxID=789 RepID=UPI00397E6114